MGPNLKMTEKGQCENKEGWWKMKKDDKLEFGAFCKNEISECFAL